MIGEFLIEIINNFELLCSSFETLHLCINIFLFLKGNLNKSNNKKNKSIRNIYFKLKINQFEKLAKIVLSLLYVHVVGIMQYTHLGFYYHEVQDSLRLYI